jgi:hypothetical protein
MAANITIVDDFLNKREIRAQAPSKYMGRFARQNPQLNMTMQTHMINPHSYGVFEDDFDKFFSKRCRAFSRELRKRIIEQEVDIRKTPVPARDTAGVEME